MFSNKSFYILALSAFIGLVLFESVASRPKNYCPNLKCKGKLDTLIFYLSQNDELSNNRLFIF